MTGQRAILIAGPTASGKSALALRLAEQTGGSIINADSMQVYRDLRILTARPSPDDEARVPHLLYGHIAGPDAYSAGRWAREAGEAIAQVRAAGRRPIIVGGSGLYFRALLQGLSPIPAVTDDVRTHWRQEARRRDPADLHAELAARDPEMAQRLRPSDPQRLTRALEVIDATGRSLAHWQRLRGKPILDEHATERLVVAPDRDDLYRRCDHRFSIMLDQGALDEVAALLRQNLNRDLPVMRALGVEPLMQLLSGTIPRDEAIATSTKSTRQYAKRQLTWLRRNMCNWKWLTTQEVGHIDVKIL